MLRKLSHFSLVLSIGVLWLIAISGENQEEINPLYLFSTLENEPERGIVEIVRYLRGNDFRIVRIGVSADTKEKQHFIESRESSPETILKLLAPDQSSKVKKKAAEAVHLMVSENYGMAQRIGLQNWLPSSHGISDLVVLVKEASAQPTSEDAVLIGEEAAEAIWALTRLSVDNLEMSVDKGAIPAFVNVIMADLSPRLTMFACACLKQLLNDQYSTPDGTYSSKARKMFSNEKARKSVVDTPGFVEKLADLLKNGRVKESTPREEWPRYALVDHRLKTSIQGWAAAAAIGTVALNADARAKFIAAGVLDVLCSMKQSPDSLEQVEVVYALQGLDEDCSGESEL